MKDSWVNANLGRLDFLGGFLIGILIGFILACIYVVIDHPFSWENKDKGIIRNIDKYYKIIEVERTTNISVDYKDVNK